LFSSLVAALLGAVALIYVAHAERLDGLPILRALSADGASPTQLVTIVVMRCAVVLASAVPVGVVCGIVLLRAVRGLVNVSADGTRPVPALRTVVEPLQVLGGSLGIALLALIGAVVVGLAAGAIRRHETMVGHA
jgi:hypothetical protein